MTALGIRLVPVLALLFAGCNLYVDEDGDGLRGDPNSADSDAGLPPDSDGGQNPDGDAGYPGSDAGHSDGDAGTWDSDGGIGDDAGSGSCDSIADEFTCVSADCGSVYEGDGCACTPTGECSCAEYVFVACKSP